MHYDTTVLTTHRDMNIQIYIFRFWVSVLQLLSQVGR